MLYVRLYNVHFTIHSKGAAATVFASASAAVSLFSLIYLYFVFIERARRTKGTMYLFCMAVCACFLIGALFVLHKLVSINLIINVIDEKNPMEVECLMDARE